MKTKLALFLTVILLLSLFAGCAGGAASPSAAPTAEPSSAPSAAPTAAPTAAPSAAPSAAPTAAPSAAPQTGKLVKTEYAEYEADDEGLPLSRFEYELPLTESDESFSFWFTRYGADVVNMITDMGELSVYKELKARTGVNIEYHAVLFTAAGTNYSVMLASDDLMDIMVSASMYHTGGSLASAVDDEFYANILDYTEYCPNYMYLLNTLDPTGDLLALAYHRPDCMPGMYKLVDQRVSTQVNYVRGDWLDEVNMKAEDIKTYDDVYNMLSAWKKAGVCDWPVALMGSGNLYDNSLGFGMDIIGGCNLGVNASGKPSVMLRDGKVTFNYLLDDNRDYTEMIRKWMAEGLADPNYLNYKGMSHVTDLYISGSSGYVSVGSDQLSAYINQSLDPDVRFDAITYPVKQAGQTFKMNYQSALNGDIVCISAKCTNIPLVVTMLDYGYTEAGQRLGAFGVEGEAHIINDKGEVELTELIYANPDGLSMRNALAIYTTTDSIGLGSALRNYMYPDAAKSLADVELANSIPSDNTGSYPKSIILSDEQTDELATQWADLGTFIAEGYFGFVSGEKSMDEWDDFAASCLDMGYEDCIAVYQEAYDAYLEKIA